MHCLLWLWDMPEYSVDPEDKVISIIDSVVTCQRTWDSNSD